MVVEYPQRLDETHILCVDVLQLLPSFHNHALLALDEQNVFEDFDVHVFVVLVELRHILNDKVGVGKLVGLVCLRVLDF